MNIILTDIAYEELSKTSPTIMENFILINYDYDGCGCVVSGVTHLIEKKQLTKTDVLASSNTELKIAYEKQYDWVYDSEMIIDFFPTFNSYQLKSKNQIFNPRMRFFPIKQQSRV